jgi:predicted exporter/SAM-dependent methyltransferase
MGIFLMRLKSSINLPVLLAVFVIGAALSAFAWNRIAIETDMVRSLPVEDPVLADGIHFFEKNPVKDQIAIDIGSATADLEKLTAAARFVEAQLTRSGLFSQVGNPPMQHGLTELADQVVRHLPVLFTAKELQAQVAPLLTEKQIRKALENARDELARMDGIDQAAAIAADPLGLRHLVLARLEGLNPAPGAPIHRGHIRSADRRHILVLATPAGSAADTAMARKLARLLEKSGKQIAEEFGEGITLTPTGAYRGALDNETIVKKDVHRAISGTAVGIAMLLLAAFSRPLTGVLALLPALAGTVMAFFVFSLIRESISILVLGFGGAVIAITADHGIAFMLFVDSPSAGGGHASREVRAVGLLAVITSVGAFGVLAFSGFDVFAQLGLFTALGIAFAFLFVHTVLPRILLPGAEGKAPPRRRFSAFVDRLASAGKPGLILAFVAMAVLALFIQPRFDADLKAMNSVSRKTRAADELMAAVRGDIFSNVYLMTEAHSLKALQSKNDRLLALLDETGADNHNGQAVTPSLFFPGPDRTAANAAAWRQFWFPERIRALSEIIRREGTALGFSRNAFAPFPGRIAADSFETPAIPASVRPLLGISHDPGDGKWRHVTRITPGGNFDSRQFFEKFSAVATLFDPALFAQRTGALLFDTFTKMLLIVGVSLVVLLIAFFADAGLVLTALLPLAFAFICTLGTLGLMGRPLDIPALMLSVVIPGMGVGSTLLLVRGYQRYRTFDHPRFKVVRMAVCMAGGSTLVGFAVLLTAEHRLLQSAGWVSFLGIGYCLAGALLILPPLLKRRFENRCEDPKGIAQRYRNMEPYPRMFARYKLRLDPLLDELEELAPDRPEAANILDVGCGFGVAACWMADRYPAAIIHGIEPQAERVRVAALTLGKRGNIQTGLAPDLPPMDVLIDMAIMLDMSHYLQDWELEKTLERIHERLLPGGFLIMRSALPPAGRPHWTGRITQVVLKFKNVQACYRDAETLGKMLAKSGFEVVDRRLSGKRGDMVWHVAKVG